MNWAENRREGFIQWYRWSLENHDCDPTLYMLNYLFDRYEHNIEQKLWVCWLFGTTYYAPTAWVIWNEFPDFELVGEQRLEKWNAENYRRLRYQVDTRYNKGHLPAQFKSYVQWVGEGTQHDRIEGLLKDNPEDSFWSLWNSVKKSLHKFGRYSTWFYLQTLRKCGRVDIEAPHLILEDQSGSKSHRNGLCLALGQDEWYGATLDKKQIEWLNREAADILSEIQSRWPHLDAEYFGMESALCSFKKIFRVRDGRYLGYYLDRQAEEIGTVERDGWSGIDWRPWWEGRQESLDEGLAASREIRTHLMTDQFKHFYDTSPEEDAISMFGS